MAIWQQLKAGIIVPEMEEDAAVGLHPKINSGADCEHAPSNVLTGKGMIDDAVEQISRLWDEVDYSERITAWEWIMRRSHHGGIIRGAEELWTLLAPEAIRMSLHLPATPGWQPGVTESKPGSN